MIRFRRIGAALILLLATCLATPLSAQTMGVSLGHDLDELLSRAGEYFAIDGEDAVVLLESRHVSIDIGGAVTTRVHRVVRVGAAAAIRDHADLRIPYDSNRSTMTVEILRTWRDGRWWPDAAEVSPTAVVETVPFQLATADDYTGMREVMLLHDGVGLPCILETAYVIEEKNRIADGADGLFVFSQPYPAVRVELVITAAMSPALAVRYENGAPEPAVSQEPDGTFTYRWMMEDVQALGVPVTANPAGYAPYAEWSTWGYWDAFGLRTAANFDEAAVLGDALSDTLRSRLAQEPGSKAKARAVAAFVDEAVRNVHYDWGFWRFAPRPASRTYDTAYGHDLDRAVLAAALFREAGLEAVPIFRTPVSGDLNPDMPGFARFESLCVRVRGNGWEAYYDPAAGTLIEGSAPVNDRIVWSPAVDAPPSPGTDPTALDAGSELSLVFTLESGADGAFKGTGYLHAAGRFSPYADMVGLAGEGLEWLNAMARSVFPGASVKSCSFETLESTEVGVGFALEMPSPDSDARGRIAVVIGDPPGGAASRLPADVRLFHEKRGAPVAVCGDMTQRVTIRFKPGVREIVQRPEGRRVENPAGMHVVTVEEKNGWLTVTRELTLRGGDVEPADWPNLRALLLEEGDPVNRTIILK